MAESHSALMDQIYSWQTGIYDITRKYYLFGRNELLRQMNVQANDQVLEVGCGTGRNLRLLASMVPTIKMYGLDCAQVMLDTAAKNIAADGLSDRIQLAFSYGEDFHFGKTFGLDAPFTKIFFSYSITMIPTWRETIENALANLTSDGELWFVDFYDQKELPGWFRGLLTKWLSLFHVAHKPELEPFLRELASSRGDSFELKSRFGGYFFTACYKRKRSA